MPIYQQTTSEEVEEILDKGPGKAPSDGLQLSQTFIAEKDIVPVLAGQEDGNRSSAMITTQNMDRDSDIVIADGGDLSNFLKNPMVLFGHNSWDPDRVMGKSVEQMIIAEVGIKAVWEWASKVSETAAKVKKLWNANFLNAISIGFIPYEWARRKDPDTGETMRGWIFSKWELLEYSIVPIPANAEALRLSQKFLSDTMNLGQGDGQSHQDTINATMSAEIERLNQALITNGISIPKIGDDVTPDPDTPDIVTPPIDITDPLQADNGAKGAAQQLIDLTKLEK